MSLLEVLILTTIFATASFLPPPSELSWIPASCTCPDNSYCIRPDGYKKPLICLNRNVEIRQFLHFLIYPSEFIPMTPTTKNLPTSMESESTQQMEAAASCNIGILLLILFFQVEFLTFWNLILFAQVLLLAIVLGIPCMAKRDYRRQREQLRRRPTGTLARRMTPQSGREGKINKKNANILLISRVAMGPSRRPMPSIESHTSHCQRIS